MQSTYNKTRVTVKFPVFEYLILLVPIVILVLIVGFYIVHYRTEAQTRSLIDEDSITLHSISGFIGAHMSSAFNHLQSISIEPETQNAINTGSPEAIRSLEQSLLTVAHRNPIYDQIRWIDETGLERIRISRGQDGHYIDARQDLQDKSQRYYFKAANSLLPGELYASKIDLNVEHAKLEMPLKPVMRIATPVTDSQGNKRGIIIINILMAPVFETVQYHQQSGTKVNYMLLNQQGDILYGSARGLMESGAPVTSITTVYPDVWKRISASDSGHLEFSYDIWTWKRISSFEGLIGFNLKARSKSGVSHPIKGEFSLIFVVQRPLGFLLEMNRNIRLSTFTSVFVVLIIYGITIFFFVSGKFRAKQAELEAGYAKTQASNMARLKEYEERFHRLVESSSVGQLVVDSDGKIEISNAAVEDMLGYDKNELIGSKVEILLPAQLQQSHLALREDFMMDPRPRKMGEGRKLEALRKDGETIPVEIGLNPYTDHNRRLVLVNVIDLSPREIAE